MTEPRKLPAWFLMVIGTVVGGVWAILNLASVVDHESVDPLVQYIMLGVSSALITGGWIKANGGK